MTSELRTFVTDTPEGEVMVRILGDGSVTVAFRNPATRRWGVPFRCEEVE